MGLGLGGLGFGTGLDNFNQQRYSCSEKKIKGDDETTDSLSGDHSSSRNTYFEKMRQAPHDNPTNSFFISPAPDVSAA